MKSPIHYREPVLFGQFGSLNRFFSDSSAHWTGSFQTVRLIEPVLFRQFGSLNRFKKSIHRLLTLSSNDVTTHLFSNNSVHVASMKHSNKVICVNTYWNIQINSYFCERILLIIAFHSLKLIMFVVTVSFADPLWQIRLTNIDYPTIWFLKVSHTLHTHTLMHKCSTYH